MNKFDVIEILRLGVIGLGFLLAFLAYRLLAKEQSKKEPHEKNIRAIKQFMGFSIILCLIALVSNFINLNKPEYHNQVNGNNALYELVWNDVNGKDQFPENDKAVDLRNSRSIFIEVEPLPSGYHESKNLCLNVLVSSEEYGKYKRYFKHNFSPDDWPAFAVTEGPNFMKLSLDVKDNRRADLKALITVGYK